MTMLATHVTCVKCGNDLEYVNSVNHRGAHTITMLRCAPCNIDVELETVYRVYGKPRDERAYRHRKEPE